MFGDTTVIVAIGDDVVHDIKATMGTNLWYFIYKTLFYIL